MKRKSTLLGAVIALFGFTTANAQLNLGEKALGAVSKGITALTFSDADAATLSKGAVDKMDTENTVAADSDPYMIRLNRIFGKHKNENGLVLNYKVYKTTDVNAFATADGSVRVFSGLMDIMDDNQLLAVIGHEIGHVANHDSRDAMRDAYRKEALIDGASSQSAKLDKLTQTQWVKIGKVLLDSHYSRKQESDADLYSYEFLKRNKYNVNAEEAAFAILAKQSQGTQANIFDAFLSSHPNPVTRATDAKARATKDGLYKAYAQGPIVNTAPVVKAAAKPVAKKTTTTKTTAKKK